MASLLRRMYRRALDKELGGVGEDLVEVQDQLDAVMERYHRLQARIGMRELRSAGRTSAPVDDSLEGRLRAAAAAEGQPRKRNGGSEWPEVE